MFCSFDEPFGLDSVVLVSLAAWLCVKRKHEIGGRLGGMVNDVRK